MKKLSVIICCYNEQATIRDVINRTAAVDLGPGWTREIVVVDNFSTDGTREILRQIDDPQVRVIFHERNKGKGMSIRTGIDAMTNLLFGGRLTDVATATKMVRADVVKSLNLTTTDFNLDFELPDKILLSGHNIIEIPITYNPRTYEEGKKIRTRDGLRALVTMLRDRLGATPVLRADAAAAAGEEDARTEPSG